MLAAEIMIAEVDGFAREDIPGAGITYPYTMTFDSL